MSDLGLKFSQSVRKRCMNTCAKNGVAPRRRFLAISEKPEGGVQTPPGPARVKLCVTTTLASCTYLRSLSLLFLKAATTGWPFPVSGICSLSISPQQPRFGEHRLPPPVTSAFRRIRRHRRPPLFFWSASGKRHRSANKLMQGGGAASELDGLAFCAL